jgi:hypothetical protein
LALRLKGLAGREVVDEAANETAEGYFCHSHSPRFRARLRRKPAGFRVDRPQAAV